MKTFLALAGIGWSMCLCALTPSQPPVLEPFTAQAVLISQGEVLCASASPKGLFLLRREGAKEAWFKVLDLDAGTTLREMDACPAPGGFSAALLLAGPQVTTLTLVRMAGDGPVELTPVKVIQRNLFPRNLHLLPAADGGAVLLFVLSQGEQRNPFWKSSRDRLCAVRVASGRVVYDRELGDEGVVHGGSFAGFVSAEGGVGVARQRCGMGKMEVYMTRLAADGRTASGKVILSLKPSARREDCLLSLDVAPDGSEVRAILAEPSRSHFYRIGPEGEMRQRADLDSPFVLLGYDPRGQRVLAADTRSPAVHWLTFSGDTPCDEAFDFPDGIVRLRQPPGPCRWWMEGTHGGTALKQFCQKGCFPPN